MGPGMKDCQSYGALLFASTADLIARLGVDARLYMAGHVESDITAGSLLGDMIGEYFLITSGEEPVPSRERRRCRGL